MASDDTTLNFGEEDEIDRHKQLKYVYLYELEFPLHVLLCSLHTFMAQWQ